MTSWKAASQEQRAWSVYFSRGFLVAGLVQCITLVALRCYAGDGLLSSLWITVGDRSWAGYMLAMFAQTHTAEELVPLTEEHALAVQSFCFALVIALCCLTVYMGTWALNSWKIHASGVATSVMRCWLWRSLLGSWVAI